MIILQMQPNRHISIAILFLNFIGFMKGNPHEQKNQVP